MKQFEELQEKISRLRSGQRKMIRTLQKKCWTIPQKREKESNRKKIVGGILDDNNDYFKIHYIEEKLIPQNFPVQYRKWYACGKAILEVNGDLDSLKEFVQLYDLVQKYVVSEYISEEVQKSMIDLVERQFIIIEALPSYLDGRTYDIKLTIASKLMGDELKEAHVLFENGFIRAAGALAGVILERHVKLRFDNARPSIKYGEKATLGQLIQKAEDFKFYEAATIQKLKYLNVIRISCDHDKNHEPKEIEVQDLIDHTDKFIHYLE